MRQTKRLLFILFVALIARTAAAQTSWYEQAGEAYRSRNYEEALSLYSKSIETGEKPLWSTYFMRSVCQYNLNDYAAAIDDAALAIVEIDNVPKDKKAELYRIYYLLADLYKQDEVYNIAKSIDYATKALKIAPKKIQPDILVSRADAYFGIDQFNLSAKDYQQAAKLKPEQSLYRVGYARGVVSEQSRRLDNNQKVDAKALKEVIASLTKILDNDKTYTAVYKFRARAYVLLGDIDAALDDALTSYEQTDEMYGPSSRYGQSLFLDIAALDSVATEQFFVGAIKRSPKNPYIYQLQALSTERRNSDYSQAAKYYTEAINNSVKWMDELLLDRARCYLNSDQYDLALSDLHVAHMRNDTNATVFYFEASAYQKKKEYGKALAAANRFIAVMPDDATQPYSVRSSIYADSTLYDLALADLDTVLKRDSLAADAMFDKATIYMKRDDRANSSEWYRKILELENDDLTLKPSYKAIVLNNLAYNMIKLGQCDDALPIVDEALSLRNGSAFIWDTRGELYHCLGQYEKCIADMDTAIEMGGTDSGNSYYFRGLSKIALGRTEEGLVDIRKAAESEHKEALEYLEKNAQ